jgi:hypothetical protein
MLQTHDYNMINMKLHEFDSGVLQLLASQAADVEVARRYYDAWHCSDWPN